MCLEHSDDSVFSIFFDNERGSSVPVSWKQLIYNLFLSVKSHASFKCMWILKYLLLECDFCFVYTKMFAPEIHNTPLWDYVLQRMSPKMELLAKIHKKNFKTPFSIFSYFSIHWYSVDPWVLYPLFSAQVLNTKAHCAPGLAVNGFLVSMRRSFLMSGPFLFGQVFNCSSKAML